MCSLLRAVDGLVRKLYHSSVRSQRFGRPAVEGCAGSSTLTVAVGVPLGWLLK